MYPLQIVATLSVMKSCKMLCFDDSEFDAVVDITLRNVCRFWSENWGKFYNDFVEVFRSFGFELVKQENAVNGFIKPAYTTNDFEEFFANFFENIATIYHRIAFIREVYFIYFFCFVLFVCIHSLLINTRLLFV